MSPMPLAHQVTLRPLTNRQDCLACVKLQLEIWGPAFVDVVPATILMVSQRVGGVAAGAFDTNGRLVGFVFGISGVADGVLTHWSDMLAIRPEARRIGLGRRLKLYQREQLLDHGIPVACWSYDPLMAVNASFNLNTLGAYPTEYVDDMYGDTGSTLHRGLDTDRLIVKWPLDDPSVKRRIAGERHISRPDSVAGAPGVLPSGPTDSDGADRTLPTSDRVRIAIPADILSLKATNPADARWWQRSVRDAFRTYLKTGYLVVDFCDGSETEPPAYVLTRKPKSDSEG
jgi:predicted GNAT superfamily acetyltransferase